MLFNIIKTQYKSFYNFKNQGTVASVFLTKLHLDFWIIILLSPILLFVFMMLIFETYGIISSLTFIPIIVNVYLYFLSNFKMPSCLLNYSYFKKFPYSKFKVSCIEVLSLWFSPSIIVLFTSFFILFTTYSFEIINLIYVLSSYSLGIIMFLHINSIINFKTLDLSRFSLRFVFARALVFMVFFFMFLNKDLVSHLNFLLKNLESIIYYYPIILAVMFSAYVFKF